MRVSDTPICARCRNSFNTEVRCLGKPSRSCFAKSGVKKIVPFWDWDKRGRWVRVPAKDVTMEVPA